MSVPAPTVQRALPFAQGETGPASVPVLVPLPLDAPFDYLLPGALPTLRLAPGDLVEVPFGPRQVVGVVWDARAAEAPPPAKLKPVGRRLPAPPLPAPLRRLIDHVAATTLAPLGNVLKLVLSVPAALEPPAPKLGLLAAPGAGDTPGLTAARRKVLAALADGLPHGAAALARAAGVGAGVVQAMAKAGLLTPRRRPSPTGPPSFRVGHPVPLSPAQAEAARALCADLGRGHSVTLLEGLPGAGKTEVYLEAVAAVLAAAAARR